MFRCLYPFIIYIVILWQWQVDMNKLRKKTPTSYMEKVQVAALASIFQSDGVS